LKKNEVGAKVRARPTIPEGKMDASNTAEELYKALNEAYVNDDFLFEDGSPAYLAGLNLLHEIEAGKVSDDRLEEMVTDDDDIYQMTVFTFENYFSARLSTFGDLPTTEQDAQRAAFAKEFDPEVGLLKIAEELAVNPKTFLKRMRKYNLI